MLHKFHEAVEERARQNGVGLAILSTLKGQIYTYEMLFGELNQVLIEKMTEMQREANRDFTPTIASIMHSVYEMCTVEHGPGSFKRMKAAMSEQVERNRHYMFNEATMTVKRHLDQMCRKLEELMEVRADEIFMKMRDDYMRVLVGVVFHREAVLSHEERALRSEVMNKLRGVDARFERIAEGDVESIRGEGKSIVEGEEVAAADDDEESVGFESARGSTNEDTTAGADEESMQDEEL